MPGQPCSNHPAEQTYVRCARCDQPFCVRCLVDTPVGRKCRPCAANRTHLTEVKPGPTLLAFGAALVVALLTGWLVEAIPIWILPAIAYGSLVGEVALRVGQRSRSVVMQVATGIAAFAGLGWLLIPNLIGAVLMGHPEWITALPNLMLLLSTVIGVSTAVSRVRYL